MQDREPAAAPDMAESSTEPLCRACKKPIPPGARVCTLCGTSQTLWGKVAVALKWFGGAATILSLLIGMNSLYGIYRGQLETREAVRELAAAADRLRDDGDYARAWKLYDQAAALDPASRRVRRGQEELARRWVPRVRLGNEETFTDIVDRTIPVLLRGLGRSRGEEAADFQALIGMAHYLDRQERPVENADIPEIYRKALAIDPDNLLANTFLGHWLISQESDIDAALPHFETAVGTATTERPLVRRYQWAAYSNLERRTRSGEALNVALKRERLRMMHDMIRNGEPLVNSRSDVNWMPRAAVTAYGPRYLVEDFEQMWSALPPESHRELIEALLPEFGPDSGLAHQARLVLARVDEELGNREAALRRYRELDAEIPTNSSLRQPLDEALERLTGAPSQYALLRTDPLAFHANVLRTGDPGTPAFVRAAEYMHNFAGNLGSIWAPAEDWPRATEALQASTDRLGQWLASEPDDPPWSAERVREDYLTLRTDLGDLLLASRRLDEAINVLGSVTAEASSSWLRRSSLYNLACAYGLRSETHGADSSRQRSDVDSAVERLTEAVRSGYDQWDHIKRDPDLDAVREHPGYRRIMAGR